jgi:hypothetical protein
MAVDFTLDLYPGDRTGSLDLEFGGTESGWFPWLSSAGHAVQDINSRIADLFRVDAKIQGRRLKQIARSVMKKVRKMGDPFTTRRDQSDIEWLHTELLDTCNAAENTLHKF